MLQKKCYLAASSNIKYVQGPSSRISKAFMLALLLKLTCIAVLKTNLNRVQVH